MKVQLKALISLTFFFVSGPALGPFAAISAQETESVQTATTSNDNDVQEQVCVPGDNTCSAAGQQNPEVYEAAVDMDGTTAGINVRTKRAKEEDIESYDDDDDDDVLRPEDAAAGKYDDDDDYEPGSEAAGGQQNPEVYEAALDMDDTTAGINVRTKRAKEEDIESYDDDDDDDVLRPEDAAARKYDDDDDYEPGPEGEPECRDEHELCSFWAKEGECQNNPVYMLKSCARSCVSCKVTSDKVGYGAAYGVAQECEGEDALELIRDVEAMDRYMSKEVSKPEYDSVRAECKNRHKLCVFWAHIGECEANPSFMLLQCAPACMTCENINYEYRCPKDESMKDIFGPGDLHKMFERIVEKYENVNVLSQPSKEPDATFQPWVITIDDFISPEECEKLIELGAIEGYERSTDVGGKKFDGTFDAVKSGTRTSENAWCHKDCYEDPMAKSVMNKIETLTGIPESHSEYLQLLKYQTGQFYRVHHDYIEHDEDRPAGPRVLTAFLYLNDVEAGGGTNFPDLDLTVMPKKGRLLLWPSVIDSNPSKKDFTTRHQALDVEAGEKYGANAWLHLRDFKTPHKDGCT